MTQLEEVSDSSDIHGKRMDMDEPQSTTNHNPACACLMSTAERELGAFISTVTELYGPEQARLSAGDWLDELESMDALPGSSRELRVITIAAAERLARGVIDLLHWETLVVAPADTRNRE